VGAEVFDFEDAKLEQGHPEHLEAFVGKKNPEHFRAPVAEEMNGMSTRYKYLERKWTCGPSKRS
jgi:hypothetical protein